MQPQHLSRLAHQVRQSLPFYNRQHITPLRQAAKTVRSTVPGGQLLCSLEALAQAALAQESRHVERQARRAVRTQRPLAERLKTHLKRLGCRAIRERRLSTPAGWDALRSRDIGLDYDAPRRLWVISAEYKYHYSNRFGDWWVGASYLCGYEDGQYFAVRLPRTVTTLAEAEAWLQPRAVKLAEAAGHAVLRQGDFYLVPQRRATDDMAALDRSHRYDPQARTITHDQHGTLTLPEGQRYRAVRQRVQSSPRRRGQRGD